MSKPRILFWDIETTHNIVAVFRLFGEDYINHDNLLQERYIVCAAWQWEGEKKVHGVSTLDDPKRFKKNPHDDRHVVQTLHDVLSQADIVVAHNGDKYDMKFYAARALAQGIDPLPPIQSIDTLKVAKSRFMFNNNRLDYLGQLLGLGRKKSTPRGLWLDVLRGDKKAVQVMLDYNKQDVVLLKAVYDKLMPFVKKPLAGGGEGCPRCASKNVQSRGTSMTAAGNVSTRYQCQACGGWFRNAKAERTVSKVRVL